MNDPLSPAELAAYLEQPEMREWLRFMGFGLAGDYGLEGFLKLAGYSLAPGVQALLDAYLGLLPLKASQRELTLQSELTDLRKLLAHTSPQLQALPDSLTSRGMDDQVQRF